MAEMKSLNGHAFVDEKAREDIEALKKAGVQGPQGEPGPTGPEGPQGPAGADGAKGDKGDTGEQGPKGDSGTSVTVSKVTESSADGESNVVTFSDGKTLTVKNGSKGSAGDKGDKGDKGDPGETGPQGPAGADGTKGEKGDKGDTGEQGPKGSDATVTASNIQAALGFEPASKESVSRLSEKIESDAYQEDIVQQVIAALGTPVFGRVDADKNIILTGELSNGTYTIKYEDADGNVTEIGVLNHSIDPESSYTNLLNTYTIVRDVRFSQSAGYPYQKECKGMILFTIPFADVMNKTLRIKAPNIADKTSSGSLTNFIATGSSNNFLGYVFNTGDATLGSATCAVYEGDNTYSFLFTDENVTCNFSGTNTMWISLVINTTGSAVTDEELAQVIVTIDEPIVD